MGRIVLLAALAGIGYFASARMGYAFAVPQGVVTLWPPSGVMLGLLVLSRRRDWPALVAGAMLGSFLSDSMSGFTPGLGLAAALANAAETLLAAWFIRWRVGAPVSLTSLRSVGYFAAGAVVGTNAITACLGAAMLSSGFSSLSFPEGWFVWWAGDGLGMLIVAPVLLAWSGPGNWTGRRAVEAAALLTAVLVGSHLTLGPRQGWFVEPDAYMAIPLLFWAGLRLGPRGAATGTLILAAVATWHASHGAGPFAAAGRSGPEVAMALYGYLSLASVSALIPAAILEERKAAAESYRNVVDTATDAIVTIDRRSRILLANPASGVIFGHNPADLVGQELTTLMPERLRADHRAAMQRYLETGRRGIAWRNVPLTGLRSDGMEFPIEVSFGEQTAAGRQSWTGIIRDISEKRAAEQALRTAEERMRFALEAARVGVWEAEFAGGQARWSEVGEALHGLAPGTFEGTYKASLERIHPDDREHVLATIERGVRARTEWHILYRTTWPDGSVHWISGVGRAFYDDAGTPTRFAGVAMDVTEQQALEEQYRQSQKMEAIGQLAGGIAHDFNNVLTAILGYGTLVEEALEPGSPLHEDLREIRRAAERAAALTAQLLAFSRRQIISPQVLDLGETIRSLEPMLRRLLGEDIDLVVRVRPEAGRVKADPGQIQQILLNLSVNARDAMAEGGALLFEVANTELDETYAHQHIDVPAGRYVLLTVSDTGVGMDAATAARVFEPFFTTKPAGKGTGLGLATVHGIVRQSGGSVAVYSEPGRGTTFKVYLPRVDEPLEAGAGASRRPAGGGAETILVVEDDDGIRKLARRVLERYGYRVLEAPTPETAIEIAGQAGPIDLLLTDVILPDMSGRAVADRILAIRPAVCVLYMSGYTDTAIIRHGVLEEGTPFIQKPFNPDALVRAIRELLDRRGG